MLVSPPFYHGGQACCFVSAFLVALDGEVESQESGIDRQTRAVRICLDLRPPFFHSRVSVVGRVPDGRAACAWRDDPIV